MSMAPDAAETYPRSDVAAMLASTLGVEKARELVDAAADRLRFFESPWTRRQAIEVLEEVSGEPGLVGITAGLAISRLHFANVSDTLHTG